MYFDCASSEQGFKIVPARVLYGIRLLLELILNDKRGVHLSIDRWWNSQTFRHDYSYQSWPHSFTRTLLMFFAMFCKLHFYVINLSQWPCIILWGQLYSKSFERFPNLKVWVSSFASQPNLSYLFQKWPFFLSFVGSNSFSVLLLWICTCVLEAQVCPCDVSSSCCR